MALINCPECNKEISDTAKNCIHCGYVLKEENNVIQPQTVVVEAKKGLSAKNSLNIGVTIIFVITGLTLFLYWLVCGLYNIPLSNLDIFRDYTESELDEIVPILEWLVIPALISVVMSILTYSVPKLRKTWFKIVYMLISLSVWPLSYIFSMTFSTSFLPMSIAYVAGIVFVIKSMVIKE